jgi:sec-independent protein translocase protein TatA
MPLNLGLGEILVILVVALLVFGGRLPQVGRSLGRGFTEFRKGLRGERDPQEPPRALPGPKEEAPPVDRAE